MLRGLHAKVVGLLGAEPVLLAQHAADARLDFRHAHQLVDEKLDLDVELARRAEEPLHGAVRQQHVIVLREAEDLAALFHHANDLAPLVPAPDELADTPVRQLEVLHDVHADQAHQPAALVVTAGKEAAAPWKGLVDLHVAAANA